MNKIVLSTVAITMLALTGANADTTSDIADMKAMMIQMNQRLATLEKENIQLKSQVKKSKTTTASKKKKTTAVVKTEVTNEVTQAHVEKFADAVVVKSKAPVLEFSGTHYLGFVGTDDKISDETTNKFETRRNYLQVKAFFAENPKNYLRVTLDTFQDINDKYPLFDENGNFTDYVNSSAYGSWEVRVKYAYLYLDNILPFTGVELGQVHRPWIDYEEHHGWFYRSISQVLVESGDAADFSNSADLGINFKTKTEYFSSELGLLNGAGYHDNEDGAGLSAEWRLTGHLLGTGTEKEKKGTTYANVSFFGQDNTDYARRGSLDNGDFTWYGFHAVYNQPEFLLSAQYVESTDGGINYKGNGYSVNGEFRFAEDWNALARYDDYTLDIGFDKKRTIAGVSYVYNKNVEFIVNYLGTDNQAKNIDSDAIMLTADVEW